MKEKISIIGGAGFLGTKLSEILKRKILILTCMISMISKRQLKR